MRGGGERREVTTKDSPFATLDSTTLTFLRRSLLRGTFLTADLQTKQVVKKLSKSWLCNTLKTVQSSIETIKSEEWQARLDW